MGMLSALNAPIDHGRAHAEAEVCARLGQDNAGSEAVNSKHSRSLEGNHLDALKRVALVVLCSVLCGVGCGGMKPAPPAASGPIARAPSSPTNVRNQPPLAPEVEPRVADENPSVDATHADTSCDVADGPQTTSCHERACREGSPPSCTEAGVRHARGEGVAQNRAEASVWFDRACHAEHAPGCHLLAAVLFTEDRTTRNLEKAFAALRKACDGDYAAACKDLGRHYGQGRDVPRDLEKAATYFQRACAQGDSESCRLARVMKDPIVLSLPAEKRKADTSELDGFLRERPAEAKPLKPDAPVPDLDQFMK